jgi:hypothetical protein
MDRVDIDSPGLSVTNKTTSAMAAAPGNRDAFDDDDSKSNAASDTGAPRRVVARAWPNATKLSLWSYNHRPNIEREATRFRAEQYDGVWAAVAARSDRKTHNPYEHILVFPGRVCNVFRETRNVRVIVTFHRAVLRSSTWTADIDSSTLLDALANRETQSARIIPLEIKVISSAMGPTSAPAILKLSDGKREWFADNMSATIENGVGFPVQAGRTAYNVDENSVAFRAEPRVTASPYSAYMVTHSIDDILRALSDMTERDSGARRFTRYVDLPVPDLDAYEFPAPADGRAHTLQVAAWFAVQNMHEINEESQSARVENLADMFVKTGQSDDSLSGYSIRVDSVAFGRVLTRLYRRYHDANDSFVLRRSDANAASVDGCAGCGSPPAVLTLSAQSSGFAPSNEAVARTPTYYESMAVTLLLTAVVIRLT